MTAPKQLKFEDNVPDLTAADLKDDEILLNVKRIGVCGSEIHSYHGLHPSCIYPVVQGHEYSGVVVAVGKAVKGFALGDKATARPQLVCGECGPCRKGLYNICENLKVQAFHADGAAQDYFIVPQDRAVLLPADMPLDYGAMVEPVAVGAHATSRVPSMEGKNVVVSGAGTIGNLIAQFAKARGAKNIKFMCLIAAPEGVKVLTEAHPDVDVFIGSLDEKLNDHCYIVPGLGDAGDRLFGTK